MLEFIRQVLSLLTTTPGSLAYHLVLAFSLAGAVQNALNSWRTTGLPSARRAVLGISLLLVVRLLLFTVAAFAWQGMIAADFLAPLDRGVALLSLVVIIWLWVFPEPSRLADTANVLLALLVGVFVLFSLLWWNSNRGAAAFQGSWPDTASSLLALVMLVLAGITLILRRPEGWGVGLSMFVLLFAGHLGHLLVPGPSGDLAPAVRLAEMAAFPLLLALPLRRPALSEAPERPAQHTAASESLAGEARLLQLFLDLAEDDSEQACIGVTQAIGQSLGADLCLLVHVEAQAELLELRCGYNLVHQQVEPAISVPVRMLPTLMSSLRNGRPLRLPASSTSYDLTSLAQFLGLANVGSLLAVPAAPRVGPDFYGILLLSPYTARSWSGEDQERLASFAGLLGRVMLRSGKAVRLQAEIESIRTALQEAQSKTQQLQRENENLLAQLETAGSSSAQAIARAESLAALVASQEKPGEPARHLEAEVQRLKEALRAAKNSQPNQTEHLEAELRLALEEIARLKTVLAESDQKLLQLRGGAAETQMSDEHLTMVGTISQELRQPMSSIVGYTDLLLGESVGILGALQRKFLERIKASIERMSALIDDLIQVTVQEGGQLDLSPETVDLNSVIDEALAITIAQMREKNILLRVDLAEHLPAIQADRDAVQQLLIHLLQNAGSATPEEGEISLRARVRDDDKNQEYILLQVSDSGGGIAAEDLPRVFSRLYRADNAQIKGLGDSGIGLSVVKTLVEAHGGRIWVDTDVGTGSTFSVLLPVSNTVAQPQAQRGAVL